MSGEEERRLIAEGTKLMRGTSLPRALVVTAGELVEGLAPQLSVLFGPNGGDVVLEGCARLESGSGRALLLKVSVERLVPADEIPPAQGRA